jgi:hypothetical protein
MHVTSFNSMTFCFTLWPSKQSPAVRAARPESEEWSRLHFVLPMIECLRVLGDNSNGIISF